MDVAAVLAAYDGQVRRHPEVEGPDVVVEREPGAVRVVTPNGWRGVAWSCSTESTADAVIARETARFAGLLPAGPWEWKHYGHDRPADLPARLLRAGFTAEPSETLLVAPTRDVAREVPAPGGVEIRPVADADDVAALVRVHEEVFGGSHAGLGEELEARLAHVPPAAAAVAAWAGQRPVSSGRITFPAGCDFAGLWGGGTLPEWRGRGVFRALVAYRARLAAQRGYPYLQVDATADSRPILRRLGFTELTTTTPHTHA